MSNKIFVGRVTVEEMTGSNGPWTKTRISFNQEDLDKLKQYQNEKGYVNLNFNRSQKGNEYLEIDTWQPKQQPQQGYMAPQPVQPQTFEPPPMPEIGGQSEENIPF